MISRKAKALGVSRPNLVVEAVVKYNNDSNHEILPDVNEVKSIMATAGHIAVNKEVIATSKMLQDLMRQLERLKMRLSDEN
jgi:hypothetical protein